MVCYSVNICSATNRGKAYKSFAEGNQVPFETSNSALMNLRMAEGIW